MNILLLILLAIADSTIADIPKSFTEHLLNGLESTYFWACIFVAYFTYLLRLWWTVDYAIRNKPNTPVRMNWEYFWNNNTMSLLRDFFTIPVIIVLYPQLLILADKIGIVPDWLGDLFATYNKVTIFVSAAVGFFYKMLVSYLRKRKWKKKQGQTNKTGLDG